MSTVLPAHSKPYVRVRVSSNQTPGRINVQMLVYSDPFSAPPIWEDVFGGVESKYVLVDTSGPEPWNGLLRVAAVTDRGPETGLCRIIPFVAEHSENLFEIPEAVVARTDIVDANERLFRLNDPNTKQTIIPCIVADPPDYLKGR